MGKKGYTKIDNDIFDCLLSPDLKDAELKIMLFIIRYTEGFRRGTLKASYRYIAQGTGYSEATVKRIIKKFIRNGILEILYDSSGSQARIFKILWSPMTTLYGHRRPHDMVTHDPLLVVTHDPQDNKEYIKDKYIKEYTQNSHSDEYVSDEEWETIKKGSFDEE